MLCPSLPSAPSTPTDPTQSPQPLLSTESNAVPIVSEADPRWKKRGAPVWALLLGLPLLSVASVFAVAWFHPVKVEWREHGVRLGRMAGSAAWFGQMHISARPQDSSLEIPVPFSRPVASYFVYWH